MRRLVLAAAILTALCACAREIDENGKTTLYFVSDNTKSLIEAVKSSKDFDALKDIVNELAKQPENTRLRSAMPNAVCESVEIADGTAYVVFSEEYGELEAPGRTLADACVALTLAELDGVENVSIGAEGMESTLVSPKDIMLTEEVGAPEVLEVTVFQLDTFSRELVSEKRRIVLREGQTAQRCLFDELKKTGYDANVISIFPAKTRLLSSELTGGVLYLDVSEDFLAPPLDEAQRLIIQGIARSFTEIEGVDGVKLMVEGKRIDEYNGLKLPEILTKDY